ncbi:response regulator transcription factor [Alicyclobacillus sp. SO9]|uniref:LuxR C-terminal-related transcriptional regulator n=1 Tax=Alicyclobacillus sp. SO9 TaxID=2665646 RepID=UPI0018E7A538|nr:response regulator transcription factor [Alicyclobacillus sp. SO9]QQE79447.1 response regulator transcription factor [Alicyclobacillus sp. SO9]
MQPVNVYTYISRELISIAIEAVFSSQKGYEFAGVYEGRSKRLGNINNVVDHVVTDIVVTDIGLEESNVESPLLVMKRQWLGLRCLYLLPSQSDDSLILRALRSGADGFIYESASKSVLLQAMKTIASGHSFLQPDITPIVLTELRKSRYPIQESDVSVDLTERERMLLQLSADGLSNQQISDVLHVHEKTVRNMWSMLFQKLGVGDRTQAVLWAIRTGNAELR